MVEERRGQPRFKGEIGYPGMKGEKENGNYLRTLPGSQDVVAAMYGAEYQTYGFNRAVQDHDVPCAVCYAYMVPAKYTWHGLVEGPEHIMDI